MTTKTSAQRRRQEVRSRASGRYAQGNVCEACGKSAPLHDYVSNPYSLLVGGRGLVLCARARCVQHECPDDPEAADAWFAERERVLKAQGARVG